MSEQEFRSRLRTYTQPGEFDAHEHLLDVIAEPDRLAFAELVVLGISLRNAFGVLEEYLTMYQLTEESRRADAERMPNLYPLDHGHPLTVYEFLIFRG